MFAFWQSWKRARAQRWALAELERSKEAVSKTVATKRYFKGSYYRLSHLLWMLEQTGFKISAEEEAALLSNDQIAIVIWVLDTCRTNINWYLWKNLEKLLQFNVEVLERVYGTSHEELRGIKDLQVTGMIELYFELWECAASDGTNHLFIGYIPPEYSVVEQKRRQIINDFRSFIEKEELSWKVVEKPLCNLKGSSARKFVDDLIQSQKDRCRSNALKEAFPVA